MADVRYEKLSGPQAGDVIPDLVDLYANVYAEPPYQEGPEQVRRFADKLPAELDNPGFTLTRALEADRLVGAAYGWTMPAGRWFSRAEHDPPPEIKEAAKLAVMEWIVHPAYRGQGIGRGLIRLLLADRTEPWAVLASDPRSDARGMYERAGWQQCGRSVLPWGPAMHLLTLPLPLR
ncbi:GNAT family N-acetyltransferase [Micromonospora sp. NPDC049679]|uniref:GNAT family N-acetyltransferase n=1 Tax=Micromonospora sp. NPDC049679 TaxID=3155920 RepID=UPI0033FED7CF